MSDRKMDMIDSDLAVKENDQKATQKCRSYLQLMKTILQKEEGVYCGGPIGH